MNFKKTTLLTLLLLNIYLTFSQSLNAYGSYPYYFLQLNKYGEYTDVKNKINYVAGLSIGKYFKSTKLEIGFAYSTKNYYINHRDIYATYKRGNVSLQYFSIPVMANKRLFASSNNAISLCLGIIFVKPFGYSNEIIYINGTKENKNNIPVDYKLGNTVQLGCKYSKSISNHFNLYFETHGEYKFNLDYYESHPSSQYSNLTDDRFSVGLNVGIEWFFNKKEFSYYKKF